MKNIENFAISDAALEQVVGGFEFKSSKVKKVLAYTGIVLGGGLALTATATGGAFLGEKFAPFAKAKEFFTKKMASKGEEASKEAAEAPANN